MAFPDTSPPRPPQKRDGADSVTTEDLQFVEDTLTSIQSEIGSYPKDWTSIAATPRPTVHSNFRALCRMEFGTLSTTPTATITIDGITYDVANDSEYFSYYRHYFPAGRFTKPPLVFFGEDPLRTMWPYPGFVEVVAPYPWRITKDYVQIDAGALRASNWFTESVSYPYFAIQPPFDD